MYDYAIQLEYGGLTAHLFSDLALDTHFMDHRLLGFRHLSAIP